MTKSDINAYKSAWYHSLHPLAKYRNFNGRKEGMKHECVICGVTISSYRKFCEKCLSLPRCLWCHNKIREPHSILCSDCKEISRLNHVKNLRKYRDTEEYKDWSDKYEQTPERKFSHALAQQTYLSTPYGKLRSHWLHHNRYLRLHDRPQITFEEFKEREALKKILPVRISIT